MGLFGFGNNKDVVDLAERYRQQKEKERTEGTDSGSTGMSTSQGMNKEDSNPFSDSDTIEERRRKLAKRILDISTKLEDLSNQMYHLQQRIELLERKASVNVEQA